MQSYYSLGTLSERTKAAIRSQDYLHRSDVTLIDSLEKIEENRLKTQNYTSPYALSAFNFANQGLQLSSTYESYK